MTWTYDPTTDLGKVRLLSRENLEPQSVLTDEDLNGFLELEGAKVRLAGADALEYIANTQELLLRKITLTGAMSLDGPAVAADLRGQAKTLREEQFRLDSAGMGGSIEPTPEEIAMWAGQFDWAEWALTPWNTAEIILKSGNK